MAPGLMTVENIRSSFDQFTVNMVLWNPKSIISDPYNLQESKLLHCINVQSQDIMENVRKRPCGAGDNT